MEKCMEYIKEEFGDVAIRISAQKHLEGYYAKHLFLSTGKEYLEDNIPHSEMIYTPNKN
jgi:ElaA protein